MTLPVIAIKNHFRNMVNIFPDKGTVLKYKAIFSQLELLVQTIEL